MYQQAEAKVMERIRQLLALANDAPEGDPERELALRKANRLMTQHAIDQAALDAARTVGEKRVPTSTRFKLVARGESAWEWVEEFRTLLGRLGRTNRCRAVLHEGWQQHDVTLVGMREDVEWSQLLWMQIFMEFVAKINPSWNAQLSLGANVARLKEAGWKWEAIWREGKRVQPEIDDLQEYNPTKARYLMNAYKAHLKETGAEAVGTQRHEAYRYSFVQAFVATVGMRLEQMAADSKKDAEESSEPGAIVLLDDVRERVDEAFYDLFPSMRPLSEEELAAKRAQWEKEERERHERDQAFLASLSPAERDRVLRERAAEQRRRERASDRYWRDQYATSERLRDDAGSRAGRAAGQQVNLNRTRPTMDHFHAAKEVEG